VNNEICIGISQMAISSSDKDVIVTRALGSCLGITAYDPLAKVGGMVHCLLPLSMQNLEVSRQNPCMYVDTGVRRLLSELLKRGATKGNLIIKVAGGARLLDHAGIFNIGSRNFISFKKLIHKNNLIIGGHDVGGNMPRTLRLVMSTGKVLVKGETETEL